MVSRYELSDVQWRRICDSLPGKPGDPGRSGVDTGPVPGLAMADDLLDGGLALRLAPDGGSDAANPIGDSDPELVEMVLAATAPRLRGGRAAIDVDTLGFNVGEFLERRDGLSQGMIIERIAMEHHGVEDELAVLG